jgi:hypothetical protein
MPPYRTKDPKPSAVKSLNQLRKAELIELAGFLDIEANEGMTIPQLRTVLQPAVVTAIADGTTHVDFARILPPPQPLPSEDPDDLEDPEDQGSTFGGVLQEPLDDRESLPPISELGSSRRLSHRLSTNGTLSERRAKIKMKVAFGHPAKTLLRNSVVCTGANKTASQECFALEDLQSVPDGDEFGEHGFFLHIPSIGTSMNATSLHLAICSALHRTAHMHPWLISRTEIMALMHPS